MKNDLLPLWEEMYRLTQLIYQLVQAEEYEQMEKLVEQRGRIIEQLQNRPGNVQNEEIQAIITKLLELDTRAVSAAHQAKDVLDQKILTLQHSRRALLGYDKDLSFTPDPFFFDQKK